MRGDDTAKDKGGRLGQVGATPLFPADDEVVIIIVKLGIPFERGGAVLKGKGERVWSTSQDGLEADVSLDESRSTNPAPFPTDAV